MCVSTPTSYKSELLCCIDSIPIVQFSLLFTACFCLLIERTLRTTLESQHGIRANEELNGTSQAYKEF